MLYLWRYRIKDSVHPPFTLRSPQKISFLERPNSPFDTHTPVLNPPFPQFPPPPTAHTQISNPISPYPFSLLSSFSLSFFFLQQPWNGCSNFFFHTLYSSIFRSQSRKIVYFSKKNKKSLISRGFASYVFFFCKYFELLNYL